MSYRSAGPFEAPHFSISSHDLMHQPRIGTTSVASNTAWVSLLAVFAPFSLDLPVTIYEWWWLNGSLTTAHNCQFGIYNEDFTQVAESAVATTTTASALINTSGNTDVVLPPGNYYMAFCDDSTRNITTSADAAGLYQAIGWMEQTGIAAGPNLPATATPVAYTRAFAPLFGMNLYTVAL